MAIVAIKNAEQGKSIRDKLNTLIAGYNSPESYLTNDVHTVLVGESLIPQDPLNEGFSNAITVNFGAGGVSSDGTIQLNADGTFEKLDNNYGHLVEFSLRVTRTTNPGVIVTLGWIEVENAPGSGIFVQVPNSGTYVVETDQSAVASKEGAFFSLPKHSPTGIKYRLRFARGEDGANQGTLTPYTPSASFAGLNPSPSALIVFRSFIPEII